MCKNVMRARTLRGVFAIGLAEVATLFGSDVFVCVLKKLAQESM
jgi:hypothetical protein